MKILLPEMELQGLAGSGEQRERAAERLGGRNPTAEMCRFCSPERSCKGLRGAGSKERAPPSARPATLRAVLRNMYKKKLAFLYTIMYYHTNFIKNT